MMQISNWKNEFGKRILLRLFWYCFVCTSLFHSSTASCGYDTFNLPQTCPSPASKAVYSAVDIGTSVFTEVLDKDSGEVTQHDFVMVTGSSYYDLIFVDDQYEVVVKSCLQIGDREYLTFAINETFPKSDCGVWILETYVDPSKPNFTTPSSVEVDVSTCSRDINVTELQFHNGGNCSSWNCSANYGNDATTFWIEGRTVRTSRDKINLNLTYEIRVTCFDNTAGTAIDDTRGDAMINVTFVDVGSTSSCTETPGTTPTTMSTTSSASSMSTMSSMSPLSTFSILSILTTQGVVHQQESVGFFQTPRNVSLLAFFGGLLVGIPSGVSIYLAAKRYACKSAVVGNGVK